MPRARALVGLLLACALSAAPAHAYEAQFTPAAAGRAVGSVLVLDVSSLWLKHPTQPALSVTSADECAARCATLQGCSAYSFCSAKDGCGTGCKAYTAKNPALSPPAPAAPRKRGERDVDGDGGGMKVPVTGFGPFVPNPASGGCDEKNTDKWAFGTCTLLKAASQGAKASSAAEGAGWSSGWLAKPVPNECSGLSASACAACSASPAPQACLSCMLDARAKRFVQDLSVIGDGQPQASTGSRVLDQCTTCSRLATADQQKRCVSCVLDDQPCSSCISYPAAASQVKLAAADGCMACVESRGKRFTGTCLTCAVSPDPGRCFGCLAKFYPDLICKTNDYVDCYKPDFDNPCAACQQGDDKAYAACVACYSSPQSKQDCESCNRLPSADMQQACYACSASARPPHSSLAGGCGLCFAHVKDAGAQKQCLGCVASAATPAGNRQHCSLCSTPELNPAQAARCFKCLGGAGGGPACATCSRVAPTDDAFKSCMACYANGVNNGPDCDECRSLEAPKGAPSPEAVRKQCFDCVVASKLVAPPDAGFAPLGSCAACLSGVADSAACVSCNTSPATALAAKSWCAPCSYQASASSRSACLACLQANKVDTADGFRKKCGI